MSPKVFINLLLRFQNFYDKLLGLDIHSGCSPVLVKNVYKRTNIAGAGDGAGDASSLMFDIVKVKGGSDGVRAGSSDEVITVTEESNETEIVEEIMR